MDSDAQVTAILLFAVFMLGPIVGGAIGIGRGNWQAGAAGGFILGLIGFGLAAMFGAVGVLLAFFVGVVGWSILWKVVLPAGPAGVAHPRCPACHGSLPDREVTKCFRCGTSVHFEPLPPPPPPPPPPEPTVWSTPMEDQVAALFRKAVARFASRKTERRVPPPSPPDWLSRP